MEFELTEAELDAAPSMVSGRLTVDGVIIRVRAVTSADILAVTSLPIELASRALAERCVTEAHTIDGMRLEPTDLSEKAVAAHLRGTRPRRSWCAHRSRAHVSRLRCRLGRSLRCRRLPLEGARFVGATHARRRSRAGPRLRLGRTRHPGPAPAATTALPRAGARVTDFLSRLIRREQGLPEAGSVGPRLPALFEDAPLEQLDAVRENEPHETAGTPDRGAGPAAPISPESPAARVDAPATPAVPQARRPQAAVDDEPRAVRMPVPAESPARRCSGCR